MTRTRTSVAAVLGATILLGTCGPVRGQQDAESGVRTALDNPAQVDFHGLPLRDAAAQIAKVHGISVILNSAALADAGVSEEVLLRGKVEDIALASALDRVLRPQGLSWFVVDDVLHLTSRHEAETRVELKIHDVSALLQSDDAARQPHVDEDRLAQSISRLIRPDSWRNAGGEGVVQVVNGLLIVQHSHAVHQEIEALLKQLRRAHDKRRDLKKIQSQSQPPN